MQVPHQDSTFWAPLIGHRALADELFADPVWADLAFKRRGEVVVRIPAGAAAALRTSAGAQ
jgi:hypothetical protein